jgi:hypothetical protein
LSPFGIVEISEGEARIMFRVSVVIFCAGFNELRCVVIASAVEEVFMNFDRSELISYEADFAPGT